MADKLDELGKAKAKSLSHHFKKMAGTHEQMAGHHEKMHKAHSEHADHHEKCMGKAAENPMHEHHKASHHFHKSMSGYHEKMYKSHTQAHEHNKAMSEAHDADDAEKVFKTLGIENTGDPIMNQVVTPQTATPATPAVQTPTPVQQTTPSADPVTKTDSPTQVSSIAETLEKAVDSQLSKAIDLALDRVLNSASFNDILDQKLSERMIVKLGDTPNPSAVKTFAVPRTPSALPGVAPSTAVPPAGIPTEFAHLIATEDRN